MKRFYLIITCQILALILFLSTHFLITIFYLEDNNIYFLGFLINVLIFDLCLFIAIGFQITSILLLISLEVSND